MILILIFVLVKAWLPLDLANYIFVQHENKERIQLSNGTNVFYIQGEENYNSIVNFTFDIQDIPSNTGLYHLLEHVISLSGSGFKLHIEQQLGTYYSTTCASTMSFTFSIQSNLVHAAIEKFYEMIYNTELDKTCILREINFIDEKYSNTFGNKGPVLFFLNQHLSHVDDIGALKFGDTEYYLKYYNHFIACRKLLTEDDAFKNSVSSYDNIVDGYYHCLTYILEKRLRKFPLSILIKTKLTKSKVVKILEKFDEHHDEPVVAQDYKKDDRINSVKTIISNKNTLRILIKYQSPNNINVFMYLKDIIEERLKFIFKENVAVSPLMVEGVSYLCILINEFDSFDYNLLQFYVFINESESRFLTYDELQHIFKHNESFKEGCLSAKEHKKVVTIIHLAVLKWIEEIDFNPQLYAQYLKISDLNSHKVFLDVAKFFSYIHYMLKENPSLFSKPENYNINEDFDLCKESLMDPTNFTVLIEFKSPNFVNQIPIKEIEFYDLDLNLHPQDYYTTRKQVANSTTTIKRMKGMDIIESKGPNTGLSIILQFGNSLIDKVALILINEIFKEFRTNISKRMLSLESKITLVSTFQNTLIIHLMSAKSNFLRSFSSFIVCLRIVLGNTRLRELIDELIKLEHFKNAYKTICNEAIEDVRMALRELSSFSEISKLITCKCMFIGEKSRETMNFIIDQLKKIDFKFTDKNEFPLVYNNVPHLEKGFEGFNKACVSVHFNDATTLLDLINNKIIMLVFKLKAITYFLNTNRIGYYNTVGLSNIDDFSSIQAVVVSTKSLEEIKDNIVGFKAQYYQWITTISKKTFEKIKKLLIRSLIEDVEANELEVLSYTSKWGYLETFEVLKKEIYNYLRNTLTLETFKKILLDSYENNLMVSFFAADN